MKKILLGLMMSMLWIQNSHAEWGDNYAMGKIGIMDVDLNSADPLLSFGVLAGIGLTQQFSLEAEYNLSLTGGDYTIASNPTPEEGDYRIWTAAIYGAFRFPFNNTAYAKLKLGTLYENIERTSDINAAKTSAGFGAAGGLGLGILAGKVLTLELELTSIDQDILFLTVGAHYRF